jgi:hypothetical protein
MVVLLYSEKVAKRTKSQQKNIEAFEPYITAKVDVDDGDFSLLQGAEVLSIGWFRFASRLNEMAEAMKGCERLIAVITDYQHPPMTQIRRAVEGKQNLALSNLPERLRGTQWDSWVSDWEYVNFNLLAWDPRPFALTERPEVKNSGLLYYGRWRENRSKYFREYLGHGVGYKVHVSTGPKMIDKYWALNPSIVYHETFSSLDFLKDFKATIYLEDIFTHTHYNSAASRFYECLSVGLPMFFDANSAWNMQEAGFDVSDYVVKDRHELGMRLYESEGMRVSQFARWAWGKDYRQQFKEQLCKSLSLHGVV